MTAPVEAPRVLVIRGVRYVLTERGERLLVALDDLWHALALVLTLLVLLYGSILVAVEVGT